MKNSTISSVTHNTNGFSQSKEDTTTEERDQHTVPLFCFVERYAMIAVGDVGEHPCPIATKKKGDHHE